MVAVSLTSCEPINIYEQTVPIPEQSWSSKYRPTFTFSIPDSNGIYDVILVFRHTEAYDFSNVWINLSIKTASDSIPSIRIEKTLATNQDGWLGTGMDDIYEHRISLNDELARANVSFRQPGDYSFTLEQIMREDPLQHVLNVGIRVEKKE